MHFFYFEKKKLTSNFQSEINMRKLKFSRSICIYLLNSMFLYWDSLIILCIKKIINFLLLLNFCYFLFFKFFIWFYIKSNSTHMYILYFWKIFLENVNILDYHVHFYYYFVKIIPQNFKVQLMWESLNFQ